MHRRRSAATAAALVVCAACSGPVAPGDDATTRGPRDVMARLHATDGPLTDLLGTAPDPWSTDYVRDLTALVTAQEETIATCMAAQGFAYEPSTLDPDDVVTPDPDLPQAGTRTYVERYGYGIADAPQAPGEYVLHGGPNGYAELSPEGRQAYDTALHGERVDVVEHTDGSTSYDTVGGCWREAGREGSVDPAGSALEDEADAYLARVGDDGSFDAIDAAWSRCMADAGYDHASPRAAYDAIAAASAAIPQDANHVQDAGAAREVRELEMRTAAADMECQVETGYAAAWAELSDAYQQRFIDTHRTEIDAVLEARR